MKNILDKLSQIEASTPELQKKKVLKESAAPVQTKPTTLKDLFYQLDEEIAPGQKPLPVMDPTNKKAGMGFVTSPDPAVQNMLKNLDPKDVQIVQAPGTQPTQPTQSTQQQQAQPAAAGATGQAPAGQTQMKEKFAGNVKLNPAKKGMFNGKTKAELEKQLSALHKSGPHKKGSPEYTKQQELNFAIRAKSGWKKSVDEADIAPTSGIDTDGAGLGAGRSNTTLEGKKAKKPDFLDLDKDGNKKETMKKAVVDKKKKSIKEGLAERIRAAHHQGKAHGLNGVTHSGKNYEDMEEARAYHEGYKEGLDECHGMAHPRQGIAWVQSNAFEAEFDEGNAFTGALAKTHKGGKFKVGGKTFTDHSGYDSKLSEEQLDELSPELLRRAGWAAADKANRHYAAVGGDVDAAGPAAKYWDKKMEKFYGGAEAAQTRDQKAGAYERETQDMSPAQKSQYDKMMKSDELTESDFAFEAWDRQLENLINEGLSVSISKDNANMPDSVSVNATDQEADKLLALVKQAGMGIFGGEDEAEMSHSPVIGGASEINAPGEIEVVDDHDGMMSLIKKMSDIGGGDHQEDYDDGDYADEEGHDDHEETCNECGMMESNCGCNEEVLDEVESEDQMEYEVAEGQAQAPQGAQNPPDNGSANSSNNTAGNNAANSALATADQTDQPEMAESKECTECHCDPCECDDEEDWHDKDGNVDANGAHDAGGHYHREREMDESFSFQNLYKKFAMLEAKTEKEDEKAEKAGKKVAKDIEYDEGHKGKDDNKAEKAGKKVTKDIEYDDKKAKKLDEWANDAGPGKTVSDTTFEQDIDFMTKVISGGLNKQKSTGQTTVPVVATQLNRLHSHDTTDINESLLDWKKLAGL